MGRYHHSVFHIRKPWELFESIEEIPDSHEFATQLMIDHEAISTV
jgi:hypothetical protein